MHGKASNPTTHYGSFSQGLSASLGVIWRIELNNFAIINRQHAASDFFAYPSDPSVRCSLQTMVCLPLFCTQCLKPRHSIAGSRCANP